MPPMIRKDYRYHFFVIYVYKNVLRRRWTIVRTIAVKDVVNDDATSTATTIRNGVGVGCRHRFYFYIFLLLFVDIIFMVHNYGRCAN